MKFQIFPSQVDNQYLVTEKAIVDSMAKNPSNSYSANGFKKYFCYKFLQKTSL
jgi:hypothetical protein